MLTGNADAGIFVSQTSVSRLAPFSRAPPVLKFKRPLPKLPPCASFLSTQAGRFDEREALDYLKSDVHVDALTTSAELTAMSGIKLCWEARLLATHRRQIYIIMMSSNND